MAAAAMPALMKVAPYAAGAMGSLLGKKMSGPSKTAQGAMQGTQAAAQQVGAMAPQLMQSGQQLTGQGTTQMGQAGQSLGQAGGYYSSLLGNRTSMQSALAPEISTAMDYYKGAGNKAQRTLRGGSRDYAQAELERDKVGKLAGMLPTARAGAAAGAERVAGGYGTLASQFFGAGGQQTGQGVQAATNAGYLQNQLFNQDTVVQDRAKQTGSGMGGMLFDLISSFTGKGPKKPAMSGLYAPGIPGLGGNQNVSRGY